MNRLAIARVVAEIFFPQRSALQLDGHGYSPTILHRILHMAAVGSSFDQAQVSLEVVGELSISARQINKLAAEMGSELARERDERTACFVNQALPREHTAPATPVALAAVFGDGGRMQTRLPGQGPGVHDPHWRETKNASFHHMTCHAHDSDPQPELPECFRHQGYVEQLVRGLKKQKTHNPHDTGVADTSAPEMQLLLEEEEIPAWQPETTFRICLSSLATSDAFGAMMACEADAHGLFQARQGVYVGDGQAYNWTIHRRWFGDFVAVTDFVHVLEYVYEAAGACHEDRERRWRQYVAWARACWQGRVDEVIDELAQSHSSLGALPADDKVTPSDPRQRIAKTMTYLANNRERMDYPRYRRQGLPVTSSLAESLVKQISKRVKGTEMFWDHGTSGEAILQLRAAVISDGEPLSHWLSNRTISPYSPRCRTATLPAAA